MRDVPKVMRISRKPAHTYEGEAWFYVQSRGIDIYASPSPGLPATAQFVLSRHQLERALEVMKAEATQ